MVEMAEDYKYSSTRLHLGREENNLLSQYNIGG